jgi:ketosteroid isomerase-like protein
MADEIVAPLSGAIKAFNDEGIETALEYFDPEIEWVAPPEWLEDRLYRGHDGLRRLTAFWTQQFDEYRVEADRYIELGDNRVLALLHQRGRIKGSGDVIEGELGYLAQIQAGKLRKVHVYFSWEVALEAAGMAGSTRAPEQGR